MSTMSEIFQDVRDATYEAAAEGWSFTIIIFRPGSRLYKSDEDRGIWIPVQRRGVR